MIRISAPGKMMIAGEYAVLYGHRALVASVDRRARLLLDVDGPAPLTRGGDGSKAAVDASPDTSGLPPEALVARTVAEARLGAVSATMTLDVTELRSEGGARKLGLGSSAAAAVTAAAAIHAAHGRDLVDPRTRGEVLEDAMIGHRRVAPDGSGADVAASALGGVVLFRRKGEDFEASTSALPSRVAVRIVWTRVEARTSELVARVTALRKSDPAAHEASIRQIADAAERMIDAATADASDAFIEATAAHGRAMGELGARAGAPIVDPSLDLVMRLAAESKGAAKPSGAGGGDVALAVFPDEDAAHRFESACAEAGFPLLCIALGVDGVTIDDGRQTDEA